MTNIAACAATSAAFVTCVGQLGIGDAAGWAQAVGSILAIVISAVVAFSISSQERKRTLADMRRAARNREYEYADALAGLAQNSLLAQRHLQKKVGGREELAEAAADGLPFDMSMIHDLERAVLAIPLHELPSELLRLTLILRSTIQQYRMKIEMAFQFHRKMDAAQHKDFFESLDKMNSSLAETVKDLVVKRDALSLEIQ